MIITITINFVFLGSFIVRVSPWFKIM